MKKMRFCLVLLMLTLIVSCFSLGSLAAPKVTTLQFQHSIIGDEAAKLVKQFVGEYEKLHPTIKIETSYIPWENYLAVTLSKLVSGNAPDVIYSATSQGAVQFMNMGVLTNLKPYLDKDPKFKNDFIPATFAELNYYGLPFGQVPEAYIFYRPDLFREAGVPIPSDDKPWSREEFTKYAKMLTVDRDKDGVVDQWGFADRGQSGFIFMKSTIPIIWSFGVDIVKKVNNKWVSGFTDPKAKEFVQYYVDLTRKDKVRPESYLGWGFAEGLRAWKDGKVAMFGVGGWFADSIVKNTDMKYGDNWDIMLYPTSPGVEKFVYETLDYFLIPKAAKNKTEAWKFLQWLYQKERLMPLNQSAFDVAPSMKTVLADPYYSRKDKPMFQKFSKYAEYGKFMPTFPEYSELWTTTVEPVLQNAVLGRITVDEAIKQLNTNINKKLTE
jgi:multiple sugar transport system substrate-binding protein